MPQYQGRPMGWFQAITPGFSFLQHILDLPASSVFADIPLSFCHATTTYEKSDKSISRSRDFHK
jgi:hypothetical protein